MKNQKVGIIVQARMGSTRLPGKVLKILYKEDKVLDVLIKRLKLCKFVDQIIIATTPDKKNISIINLAKSYNISFFIGNENNVLKRYYKAAKKNNLNVIIRVTSDNPLVDPIIIDNMILFFKEKNFDYIVNHHDKTNFPIGLGLEILSFRALEIAHKLAKSKFDKEHITPFIIKNPNLFKLKFYDINDIKKINNLRLTIDEKEDLIMVRKLYKKLLDLGKDLEFTIYDIINTIEKFPELLEINKHITQLEKI
ncbi:MAG: cytidylyltransferase domain-containing protein [Promethearchaeota archaeon]